MPIISTGYERAINYTALGILLSKTSTDYTMFGATSFLARPDSATLPVVIFRLIGRPGEGNYAMALAAAVVLAAVTTVVVLAVERLRVPSVGAF